MARFMVKVLLLICTLLLGILIGIHQAEHGILSIMGNPFTLSAADDKEDAPHDDGHEPSQDDPEVYIKRIDGEEMEVEMVGQPFSIEDLEEKEERWEALHHQNRYSQLGSALGEAVYSISRTGAEWFARQLDKVL